jgi:signal transduction histidine kinase
LTPPEPTKDLLAHRAMPQLAAALRQRVGRVIELWTAAVERYIPDADPLTLKQVRNSIPTVLEKIAQALESDRPEDTTVLEEVGTAHGVARAQENYNVEELLIEYRLLRRIVFDEITAAAGAGVSFADAVPVNMAVDTALHRGVVSFVRSLETRLKAAAEAESKYLTYLSHDLRNNLNAVTLMLQGLGHSLADSPQFREEAKDVDDLRQAVFETIGGMDRLLHAERLRKGAVTLKLGPVKLRPLAAEMLAQVARRAAEKGLRLENAVPDDAAAHSDRELLTLVLQNLLGNAVKYSRSGTVRVTATGHELGWQVAVRDQGPGIPPERRDALFQAFSRGETHGEPGVGLGLSIASQAARLLGSELTVDSTVGVGSTFSFTVPPARTEDSRSGARYRTRYSTPPPGRNRTRRAVLIGRFPDRKTPK